MGWHDLRPDLATDRHSINPKRCAQPVIGLDQRPYRVASLIRHDDPRGRAGAALELVANHAGATTDVAFRDRPASGRRVKSGEGVLRFKWKGLRVAQPSVIGLGDHRKGK